jgi:hypothetical protein
MSVEQLGVLALLVLLPLLEGVARLWRAHADHGVALEHAGQVRTLHPGFSPPNRAADDAALRAATPVASSPPSLPRPLPQLVPRPPISLSRPSASRTALKVSASSQAHTTNGKSVSIHRVVQWLRPVDNLRHAIIVATILGPPPRQ